MTMYQLLTNKGFQIWSSGLASIGTLGALIATGSVTAAVGVPIISVIAGGLIGINTTPPA